jgi:hypothetical protein
MPSIFPDQNTGGGVVYRDAAGNPIDLPHVHNAYSPAPGYIITCPPTALPSDCEARIEPIQINAIVSELLALSECWDANGPWDCTHLNNLCRAFREWAKLLDGGTFEGTISPTTRYMHRRSSDPFKAFPSIDDEPLNPGEIAVNTANLQIAVGDADPSSVGNALPLIGIRFWSQRAKYNGGDFVVFGSDIYQAIADIDAGTAFDPLLWRDVTGIDIGAPPGDSKVYGSTFDGTDYSWVETVKRAGDSMLGPLLLRDETPPNALAAVPKQWVEKIPIAFPVVGKPIAATALYIPVVIPMTIPPALAGTIGFANVAATANAVFTLNKIAAGGVVTALGTITAPPGAKTGFALAGAGGALAVGEILQLVAPTTQDTTLADVGITLVALRA